MAVTVRVRAARKRPAPGVHLITPWRMDWQLELGNADRLRPRALAAAWRRAAPWAALAAVLGGCSVYKSKLIEPTDGAANDGDGIRPQLREGGARGDDAQVARDAMSPGDRAGADAAIDASGACSPNPAASSDGCEEICPETCDGNDEDCDGEIDEGAGCAPACLEVTTATREYRFCSDALAWEQAQAACAELGGGLATIGDAAENELIAMHLESAAWVGHNQRLRSGVWVWSSNGVPFWQGEVDGSAVAQRHANWSDGHPQAGSDCGELDTSGGFRSRDCADLLPFVCEIGPDGCAGDPDKQDPGQCGCGVPDVDADRDAFAACNDACDDDPLKLVPGPCGCGQVEDADGDDQLDCEDTCPDDPDKYTAGVCGCGVPDTDSDDDNNPDCTDACPDDPTKIAEGACGCGVPDDDDDGDGAPNCNDLCRHDPLKVTDVDSDGDGALDCNDGCPGEPTTTGPCFPFTHSNFDASAIDFQTAPEATLDGCSGGLTTVTTSSGGASFSSWCGAEPSPLVQSQDGGPDIVVLPLRGLTVGANHTLRLRGTLPVVFAVLGDATIAGRLEANASGATPGAGGDQQCDDSAGGNGAGQSALRGAGGGGGGFGTRGGSGGNDESSAGGSSGRTRGDGNLTPLLGGCRGGYGGGGCNDNRGAGAGALQITARGSLRVSGSIEARGGDGQRASCNDAGGTGGGSGGAILLEGASTEVTGMLRADGGSGGSGQGGTRGGGGASADDANGAGGAMGSGSGAGGGGGGYGRIRTR